MILPAVACRVSFGAASTRAAWHLQRLRPCFRFGTAATSLARLQLLLVQERSSQVNLWPLAAALHSGYAFDIADKAASLEKIVEHWVAFIIKSG